MAHERPSRRVEPGGGPSGAGAAPVAAAPDATPGARAPDVVPPTTPGERWKLIAGWLVVGVPSAWGVAQVVVKSLALFE